MSNALIFSTGKVVGGGIMPKINEFKTAAAYEDDGRIVVIPFPSSANDNVEVYYSASLSGTLKDHIVSVFKAENIVRSKFDAGSCIASVWRPGRVADDNISVNDKHNENLRSDKQALLILVTKLSEIFLTIEPTVGAMDIYGHKVRELHLLACMEVENYLTDFLKEAMPNPPNRPTTNDYVNLAAPLYLKEYKVDLPQFPHLPIILPSKSWSTTKPTGSLAWYDHYNKSKHSRRENFGCSTLGSTIDSVAAALVLFTVRHGIHQLFGVTAVLSLQVSQIMRIDIEQSDLTSWYVRKIELNQSIHRDGTKLIEKVPFWMLIPLKL